MEVKKPQPNVKTKRHEDGRNWIGTLIEGGVVVHTCVRLTEQAAKKAAINREPRFSK